MRCEKIKRISFRVTLSPLMTSKRMNYKQTCFNVRDIFFQYLDIVSYNFVLMINERGLKWPSEIIDTVYYFLLYNVYVLLFLSRFARKVMNLRNYDYQINFIREEKRDFFIEQNPIILEPKICKIKINPIRDFLQTSSIGYWPCPSQS